MCDLLYFGFLFYYRVFVLSLFVVLSCCVFFFFFKQKTAYEMRISDWSSDVCSSDLQYGHAAFEGGRGPGGPGGAGFDFTSFSDIFDDLFGEFMGGRGGPGGRGNANRGSDLRYNLEITLEDCYRGKNAKIRVPTSIACEACDGSGAEAGQQPIACPTCKGHGKVRAQQGFFTIERTCPTCAGAGRVIEKPCKVCGGAGRVHNENTLEVDLPPGGEEGKRHRQIGRASCQERRWTEVEITVGAEK